MEALLKAIEHAGSQTALAKKLGMPKQNVHAWLSRGNIPAEWVPRIEAATDGMVRAEELRPDIPWHVIRANKAA
jgi:DNA-binding transcriptional regulator YdaS (Cro superfamily)